MASETWTLIDLDRPTHSDAMSISGSEVCEAANGCSVHYEMLRGGLRDGVHLLTIDNGALRVALLPERGMGIWKAWAGDIEIGWQSPVKGPVHPQWVPLTEPGGLGWLDGFDELLVRCGLESNGAPEFDADGRLAYPLHGRIANLPAHTLEVSIDKQSGEIMVVGIVDETRFHFHKLRLKTTITMRPGDPTVAVRDEVTNLSGNPGEMQLLYHINFGPPIHTPGAELVLPVKEVAPRDAGAAPDVDDWNTYRPGEVAASEQVYFFDLHADSEGQTRALLKNAEGNRGVTMHYNVNQLPCFSQWKNTPPDSDGYVTGLEPATNFPNPRSFESEQGRVIALAAGETRRFDLAMEFHPDADSVIAAQQAVQQLANGAPIVHTEPRQGWSF